MTDGDHMSEGDQARPTIQRLIGIYNANGTLRGEISYWVGARLGRAHCALCDITHGPVKKRRGWQQCEAGLPVPFATFHLDDQPDAVRTLLGDTAPGVVADTDRGLIELLGPAAIEACAASPSNLADALTEAARSAGLDWPTT